MIYYIYQRKRVFGSRFFSEKESKEASNSTVSTFGGTIMGSFSFF